MIPHGQPLRVVGDVHGDARAFAFAAETDPVRRAAGGPHG